MLFRSMEEIVVRTGFQGGMHYHSRILDAVIQRDPQTAMEVMREHIRSTISRVENPESAAE